MEMDIEIINGKWYYNYKMYHDLSEEEKIIFNNFFKYLKTWNI